jgi:hypothetical protein
MLLFCVLNFTAAETMALAGTGAPPSSVAVLDFTLENAVRDREQGKIAADVIEMSLQRNGVATLERRQIRLVLGERTLWRNGLISSASIQAAQLPLPEYFIEGTIPGSGSNRFIVNIALVNARTATLAESFSGEGKFPEEWAGALDKIAGRIAARLNQAGRPPPVQPKFEGITWMPESAFKFFSGIERYAAGDYGAALAMFHELRIDDRDSKLAWLWEARCYKQCGLPEQAGLILDKMRLNTEAAVQNSLAQNCPVVAVLALDGVSAPAKSRVAQLLAESAKVRVFDPAWIGATAREADLQLTGEMAAPADAKSVWLAVDQAILLDVISEADGSICSLRLRRQDLLSGQIVYEEDVRLGVTGEIAACEQLADQFLKGGAFSPTSTALTADSLKVPEPGPQDSPSAALAKAVNLLRQTPDNLRYRIGLADSLSPWTGGLNYIGNDRQYPMDYYLKLLCLDQVIRAVEKQRDQPDASFLLASALWRERTTRIGQPWKGLIEGGRWQVPLEQEFKPLRECFPQSEDYVILKNITNSSPPPRYLQGMFSTWTNPSVPVVVDGNDSDARLNDSLLADLRGFVQQTNTMKAYELFYFLIRRGVSNQKLNEAFPQIGAVYGEQQRFFNEFNQQTNKFDEHGQLTPASQHMMTSCNAELRMYAFRSLLDAADKELSPAARAAVMRDQVASYLEDFGPLSSLDGNVGVELNQFLMCWRKANAESAAKHYANADGFYEVISQSSYVGKAQRLTAAYDLASDYFAQKKLFEASELLKEILMETDHGSMQFDRAYTAGGGDLRSSAFALLKNVRLYGDANLDMNQCCGPSPRIQEPDAQEEAVIESLFQQWVEAGPPGSEVGTAKSRTRAAIAKHGQAALPLLIRELELGKMARWQLLRVFSELGPDAAPAINYILPYVSSYKGGHDRADSLGAIDVLIKIGAPAASCALPVLIVTSGQDDPYLRLSAEEAIRVLSPAPVRTIPWLARLLDHPNPDVCLRAAKEIVKSAHLSGPEYDEKKSEQLVLAVRKWWENNRNKIDLIATF